MKKLILIILLLSNLAFSQYYIPNGINSGSNTGYNPKSNLQNVGGGYDLLDRISGYTYEPETTNYFATLSGTYDENYKKSLDTLIKTLKTFYAHNPADTTQASDTTLLNRFDRFYNLMTANGDDALIEIRNVESMSLINTPVHWAYRGYITRATGEKIINTNFTASTDGVKYTNAYASFLIYIDTNVVANSCDYGGGDGTIYTYLESFHAADGKTYFDINGNANTAPQSTSSSIHGYLVTRHKNKSSCYIDGVFIGNNNNTNQGLAPNSAYIGAYNNNGVIAIPANRRYLFYGVAGFFSNRDAIIIHESINKFKTYVKANY
jgi:hypothetical protein